MQQKITCSLTKFVQSLSLHGATPMKNVMCMTKDKSIISKKFKIYFGR